MHPSSPSRDPADRLDYVVAGMTCEHCRVAIDEAGYDAVAA